MPRVASAAPRKRAAPKSTQLAVQFPKDTLLTDILKKEWRLGDVIGQGGFGLVYHANKKDSSATSDEAQYVIKIEPGSNGPLFCEMNFYIRAAKNEFIQGFTKSHKLKYLAVPPYIGSGMHSHKSVSYRFLVMPRYGTDLQKMLQTAGGTFSSATVFAIGLRMIDAFQYLHEREYVHADIKASNILLGFDGRTENRNQVCLADYGLAYRYTANNVHKEYRADPKNAHNGTLELTSRDAHKGVYPSRRGDLEILGYCLVHWLCGKLPWESHLANPALVAQKKEEYMMDVGSLIRTSFSNPSSASAECVQQYLQQVSDLGYQDEPDYKMFKDLLKSGLTKAGQSDEWKISFSKESKTTATKRKSTGKSSPKVSPKKARKTPAATSPVKRKTPAASSPVKRKTPAASSPVKRKTPAATSPVKRKMTVATSPVKRKGRSPKTSPAVPKTSPVVYVPVGKRNVTSPLPKAVNGKETKATAAKKRFDASKKPKTFQIPPPSKPSPKKSPVTPRQKTTTTIRRVRKAHVSRTDACIQTTPTLNSN